MPVLCHLLCAAGRKLVPGNALLSDGWLFVVLWPVASTSKPRSQVLSALVLVSCRTCHCIDVVTAKLQRRDSGGLQLSLPWSHPGLIAALTVNDICTVCPPRCVIPALLSSVQSIHRPWVLYLHRYVSVNDLRTLEDSMSLTSTLQSSVRRLQLIEPDAGNSSGISWYFPPRSIDWGISFRLSVSSIG